MSKELEIEFKNMLEKEEYEKLAMYYGFLATDAKTQENFYLDTPDFQLKNMKCALRIRKKHDGFECTLKTPAAHGNFEITDVLTAEQAAAVTEGHSFEAPEVRAALKDLSVSPEALQLIGALTTLRMELETSDGLLVLDHSEYAGTEDYEIEFEVEDVAAGEKHFYALLESHGIPVRQADKKIARFMAAAERRH
ncbi:MAG TPA: CYTH domain-containing protein [Planococcus sp. (in: firmicutes)]|nr:CYTH domain-containing protein [Planococcus sp. (in: firmicutes)]